MPASSTVYKWLLDQEHKAFSEQYATARAVQAEAVFEELLEIADDGSNDWMEKERQDGSSITVPDTQWKNNEKLLVSERLNAARSFLAPRPPSTGLFVICRAQAHLLKSKARSASRTISQFLSSSTDKLRRRKAAPLRARFKCM
jgi:hypothetical protein